MNLLYVFLNHTLKTNRPVLVSNKKKNCFERDAFHLPKPNSVISHLMSKKESCIQECSETIKKQMENTRKEWSV